MDNVSTSAIPRMINHAVVHKESVSVFDGKILVPIDAIVLTVRVQQRRITVWYITRERVATTQRRSLDIVGMGWPLSLGCRRDTYVGTVECDELVWHVFDPEAPSNNTLPLDPELSEFITRG